MKKATLVTVLVLVAILVAHVAIGDIPAKEHEEWIGKGTLYKPDNTPLGTYDIKLFINPISEDTIMRNVFIELHDGNRMAIECEYKGSDALGWSVSCKENGKASERGTMHCFDDGVCQEITVKTNGQTSTNTIVEMSKTKLHLVRTLFNNGEVTMVAHDVLNLVSE